VLLLSAHLEKASISTRELHRTILMMGFHTLVCLLITNNVQDTQCGFKLFTRATAGLLFSNLHLERWAFDVEIIYLAEALGIPIAEVSVNWHEVAGSKLITTKWDIVTTSLSMAKDMFTVKCAYTLGLWQAPAKPQTGPV
jgi:dolichyl-phosphate beta-glucosyltransferase